MALTLHVYELAVSVHAIILRCLIFCIYMSRKSISVKVPSTATPDDIVRLREYLDELPIDIVLSGLGFVQARWHRQNSGTLNVGRKGIINTEVHALTSEQARWRLDNWKIMISEYRRRGYSYPTISRIKKRLNEISG